MEELECYTLLLASEYKSEWDTRRAKVPLERFFDFPRISTKAAKKKMTEELLR